MVAIFDYDPRESSPNTDIEVRLLHMHDFFSHDIVVCCLLMICLVSLQAELTFSAGDIIHVFGDMDEDGFFYVSVIKTVEFKVVNMI